MYKEWLFLTCKWATKRLDVEEFKNWQRLSMDLGKMCEECEEGNTCECGNTGLQLTALEKLIFNSIEMSLEQNKGKSQWRLLKLKKVKP